MNEFSLFLPTREREELLNDCVDSILSKAKHPERVEIIIVMDEDDESNLDFEMSVEECWMVEILKVPRSAYPTRDYLNVAAAKCSGEYIWGLNDDCEIVTNGWDEIMEDKIEIALSVEKSRDAYIHMDDTSHIGDEADKKGCCFPMLTRELYSKLGCYMPYEIATWGADTVLYDIVKRANVPIIKIPEVSVLHKCHHNGTRERDDVNKRVEQVSHAAGVIDRDAVISKYVELVKAAR